MTVATWTGIVENGQIRLTEGVRLPEKTLVYVVVPNAVASPPVRVASPRLANPRQASDFTKTVTVESEDAGI